MDNLLTDRQFWVDYWESKTVLSTNIPANYLFHQQLAKIIEEQKVKTAIELGGFPGYYAVFLKKYFKFADFVWDNNLQDAHVQRPLLDGNEIQDLFGLRERGVYLKSALDALMEWQFDHPGCRVGEAKAWLLGNQARLGIP